MIVIDEIMSQPTGARFFRADLHIHSVDGSHDVEDAEMTTIAIVKTAEREDLTFVAITDHNEIGGVKSAIEASKLSPVYVIPGIELSTSQGHLLCYLPTLEALHRFHGQLTIVDRGRPTSRCQQSILDCLNLLPPLGGFGMLAHVDAPSGFEVETPGASPHKFDVICHPALLGIELKHATSQISYAEGDPDPERVRMGRERVSRLKLGTKQNLARVLNSDAHALDALGRNAASARKVTRYKMDLPSFDGLRIALEDADARVRIEDQIPQAVPKILGMHIDGGFLSGQVIQFSPNLNCIIGGRGTGKSTAFEAVRCVAAGPSDSTVIDSEAWPDELHLVWEDQAGQQHTLFRPKDAELQNIDTPEFGPCGFEVDCFGQGEAARISIEAKTDPLALLNYLDKFVDLKDAIAAEEDVRSRLLTLQTEIEKAELNVSLIPQYQNLLTTTQQQLAALKKPEVKELIELQQQLATERELRDQIVAKLREAKADVVQGSPKATIQEIRALADPAGLSVGAAEFQSILEGATNFEAAIGTAESQIKAGLLGFEKIVSAQVANWKAKDTEAQKKVDTKRKELEALKVKFDMSYIAKLAKDEASHHQNVKNLQAWEPHLKEQKRLRTAAIKDRWATRERIALLRDAYGRQATKTLREALSDLQVSLKYTPNAYSPEARDKIIDVMGWKTNQQVRAGWLITKLTLPTLLACILKNDPKPILALKTIEGASIFKTDEAQEIIKRLSEPSVQFMLERLPVYDLPRLQVSQTILDGEGGPEHITRDFSKLSLGQQQSVLLALILSSDSNRPLIIDQPEDNLDGEFIYTTLVPVLRRAKERRQVIIVTHNPNVAVLGDAELVLVMKALNNHGKIVARGSIDHPETRDAACAILEGAREAFLRRAKMYGIQVR